MGFSTYDALVNALTSGQMTQFLWLKEMTNGTTNALYTLWPNAGHPVAGSYSGTALAAQQLTGTSTGAIGFADPPAGKTRHVTYMVARSQSGGQVGTLILVDRLLYYPGIDHNTTSAQSFTNGVSLPRYTSGVGVLAWLEVTSALGATAQNCTLTYTDDQGNASNSTGAQAMIASSAAGRVPHTFFFFPLAAGDKGIRSVQTVQFSAANTGTSALALGFVVAILPMPQVSTCCVNERDYVVEIPMTPRLQDGACLGWLLWSAGTAPQNLHGLIQTAYN